MLVLYTNKALGALKGVEPLNAWTLLQVFQANRSYKLSNLTHQIRLVSVDLIQYDESSNSESLFVLVEDLGTNAHALRNDKHADAVVLLTQAESAGSAGIAETFSAEFLPDGSSFEPYAYAVVDALEF